MACATHQLWNLGSVRISEEEQKAKKTQQHGSVRSLEEEHKLKETHQLWVSSSEEHKHRKSICRVYERNNKESPNTDFKHKATKEFHHNSQALLCSDDRGDTDFVALLRACGKDKDLHRGTRAHDGILKRGLLKQCLNPLVAMYVKCGAFVEAEQLLYVHKSRDVFSWTTLIAAYAEQGQGRNALNCFEHMQRQGLSSDTVTYACILKACGGLRAAEKGEQIHEEIARQDLLGNNYVLGTALVDMYAKCGVLTKAQQILENLSFRNVTCWNALIAGYAQQGQGEQALNCFGQMQQEGISPNRVTFTCILKACGTIGAADMGEHIHEVIVSQELLGNDIVLGTALMDMYIKCGNLSKAQCVLNQLPSRDVACWNALITGYAQQGQGEQALNCFELMQDEGLSPNAMTFSCVLKACSSIGAADKGEKIHDQIARQGLLGKDVVLGTALVDMYAKCGALTKAAQVLEELSSRNVTTWNALITGYAQWGQDEQALNYFEKMQCEGLSPNAVTFSCVLSACSHIGLVDKGHMHFVSMSTKYGVKPDLEHYACMVDLFGRAGHLEKAIGVIQQMSPSHYSSVLATLLGACQKWGDVKVGRWAFEHAIQVDRSDTKAYVLMANIYAAAGMQEDAEIIEAMRMENKARRKAEDSQKRYSSSYS